MSEITATSPIFVTVTGLPGPQGDITPELTALAAQVSADKDATAASAADADTAKTGAEEARDDVLAAIASIPVPATQLEVDEASAVKTVTANLLGKIQNRIKRVEAALGISHTLAPVSTYDDFAGTAGTITGRVTPQGAATWTALAAGSNVNPIQMDGSGKLSGGFGTSPNLSFVVIEKAATPRRWIRRRGKVNTGIGSGNTVSTGFNWGNHISVGGGTMQGGIVLRSTTSTSDTPQGMQWIAANGGVAGGATSLGSNHWPIDDDTYDIEEFVVGGALHAIVYQNGRQYGQEVNLSGLANVPTFNYKYGFRGNIAVSSVNEFAIIDTETEAGLRQYCPNRIVQMEADGTVVPKLRGAATAEDPAGVEYTVLNHDESSALVDWREATDFAYDSGTYTARGASFSPDILGFHIIHRRFDVEAGVGVVSNTSPLQKAGHVILHGGQSLQANALFTTSGGEGGAPADGWYIHGCVAQGAGQTTYANAYDRRQMRITASTPMATFCAKVAEIFGSAVPITHVIGTLGGTNASQRAVGTDAHNAQRDGVIHAGGDIGSAIYGGGQFDVLDPTLLANYISAVRAEMADIRTLTGRNFKTLLMPLTSVFSATDADSETLRKAVWLACQTYPDEFALGPYMMDMQHRSGDVYHFVDGNSGTGGPLGGYDEQFRRQAYCWARMMGKSTLDLTGPKLFSLTKDSSSQLTVVVDLNGADGIDLLNYAYAGDRRGGLRFAASSDFASPLSPSGHSIGTPSAGKCAITFTFDGTPFAVSDAFVSGPYGREPFNPSGDTTIRADYANKASMLVGTYAGKPSVPIQPYYRLSGGDYLSAS